MIFISKLLISIKLGSKFLNRILFQSIPSQILLIQLICQQYHFSTKSNLLILKLLENPITPYYFQLISKTSYLVNIISKLVPKLTHLLFMDLDKDFKLTLERLKVDGQFLIEIDLNRLIMELEGKLMVFIPFIY